MNWTTVISLRNYAGRIMLILSLALSARAYAQTNTPRTAYISDNIGGYWEYLPADYATSGKTYPVLFFFHGVGEIGDGSTSSLQLVLKNGPPKLINQGTFPKTFTSNGQTFSFIVICPQMKTSQWKMPDYNALVAYAKSKYRIDTSRIYLTGLSMGGGNAMYYASNTASVASTIAAVATASEASRPNSYTTRILGTANTPVWLCTNKIDPTVPPSYSISWHDSLAKFNAPKMSPQPILDIFDASGHDSWTQTFDPNFRPRGVNVYEWLLQYKRGGLTAVSYNVYPKITAPTSVTLPTASITLDGTASTTENGATISSYSWKVASGPAGYTLTNATTSKATLSNLSAGTYSVQLSVTNNKGVTTTASASIVVKAATGAPVAVIDGAADVTLPTDSVTLDGSKSYDNTGSITSYSWSYVSGPTSYSLTSATTASTCIKKLGEGSYKFKLTVKDDKGISAADTASFTVKSSSVTGPVVVFSAPATVAGTSIVLNGSGSYTVPGHTITKYDWRYISGPKGSVYTDSTKPSITVSDLVPGVYIYQLKIGDDLRATASARVTFTVTKATSQVYAKISAPATVTLPTTSITLDGTASSTDNGATIASYAWSVVTGPTGYSLSNGTSSTATLSNIAAGTYTVQLSVTNNQGVTASTTTNIAVASSTDITGPVVVFKAPQIVSATSVILDVSESYTVPGRSIVKYDWKYISGPKGSVYTDSTKPSITLTKLTTGTYTYQAKIGDDGKATAFARIIFVVAASSASRVAAADTTTTALAPTVSLSLPNVSFGQEAVLKLAPVPTRDNLKLMLNNKAAGKVAIRVTDMSGRTMLLKNAATKEFANWQDDVNVSAFTSGVYFVEIFVGNEKFTGKFIKER